ncbi:MAG TPA: hypothetical protein DDZ90_20635 [Planctomycetaceae bacterium]|nr:hypothetical protein [Gimesia sp.]HBL45792.1 hypothetical protein [Planctomycetaceae bacterium]
MVRRPVTALNKLTHLGLHGVKLIVSDGHEGLNAARQNMLAGTPLQRYQFHLMQNAMQLFPKFNCVNRLPMKYEIFLPPEIWMMR